MEVADPMRAAVLAAVKEHRLVFNYWGEPIGCDCSLTEDMTEAEHAQHFTDVLMNLLGITVTRANRHLTRPA